MTRRLSVRRWTEILGAALLKAEAKRPQWNREKLLKKLNEQANSIRSWDIQGHTLKGWRLIP